MARARLGIVREQPNALFAVWFGFDAVGESHPSTALHESYTLIERRAAGKREDPIDTTRCKCAEVINQMVGSGVNLAIGT